MAKPGVSGLRRIFLACGYSWSGFCEAWKTEESIRQEMMLMAVLMPVAFLVEVTPAERAIMLFSAWMIVVVELINSAIENAIDRISDDLHPVSKRAKDIGSAAVFVTCGAAALVWLVILI